MRTKGMAHVLGIFAGLLVWLAVGSVGILIEVFGNVSGGRDIAGWIGMFAGAGVWNLVVAKLGKRWSIR